jgi:hypothetical protein
MKNGQKCNQEKNCKENKNVEFAKEIANNENKKNQQKDKKC